MDNPTNSGADAAYERALAAYREKSYEVARRWVLEALAHNRQHSAAKALLARLDAARRDASPFETPPSGSEVVSTDPTVLLSRAGGVAPAAEPIEPTVMLRRDNPPRRASDTDTHAPIRIPKGDAKRPVADSTVIAQSKPRSSSSRPKSSFSLAGALQSLGGRSQGRADQSRASSSTRGKSTASGPLLSTPAARGALLAVATVAIGALLVWAAIGLFHWLFPAGHVLTITKPENGTITGPGIECGTRGSDCSTTFRTAEVVELDVKPDKDYVFSGYTGDCAPAGRPMMTEPRTCSATFQPVVASAAPVTFRLTITKPEGGTVIAAGGIMCGTIGSTCSAEIPSGQPVTLTARADDGYVWEQFTGDCPATGETIMTSAKTCTAVFAKTAVPIASAGPRPTVTAPPRRPSVAPPNTTPAPPPTVSVPVGGGSAPPPTTPSTSSPTAPLDKPPERPKTAEEHAKDEILQLVKNYCTELGTLKPERIRPFFHLDNGRELRDKLKEYKSLKCTVSAPPEYDRIDARDAGAAQLKFGMKQAVEMKSGGAPATLELNVTMVVSRKDFQSPWLIDRLSYEVKPKS